MATVQCGRLVAVGVWHGLDAAMSRAKDLGQAAAAAQAIDRVLSAERDAETLLAQERRRAEQTLERAREDALACINRALDRVAAWQHSHAAALDRRLSAHRAGAAASARDLSPPGEEAISAAVAQVAARLTGGLPGAEHGDGRS
jgi:vacuolar-type H+-ATPase subunit H